VKVKGNNMKLHRATIEGFAGSYGSGLATLQLSDGPQLCDNGPTVRALESAFGDCIGEGHTCSLNGAKGQDIICWTDGFMLAGFGKYVEYDGPAIEMNGSVEVPDGQ
jgi:hypothetical protein